MVSLHGHFAIVDINLDLGPANLEMAELLPFVCHFPSTQVIPISFNYYIQMLHLTQPIPTSPTSFNLKDQVVLPSRDLQMA